VRRGEWGGADGLWWSKWTKWNALLLVFMAAAVTGLPAWSLAFEERLVGNEVVDVVFGYSPFSGPSVIRCNYLWQLPVEAELPFKVSFVTQNPACSDLEPSFQVLAPSSESTMLLRLFLGSVLFLSVYTLMLTCVHPTRLAKLSLYMSGILGGFACLFFAKLPALAYLFRLCQEDTRCRKDWYSLTFEAEGSVREARLILLGAGYWLLVLVSLFSWLFGFQLRQYLRTRVTT